MRYFACIALIGCLQSPVGAQSVPRTVAVVSGAPVSRAPRFTQLRLYTINSGKLDDFVKAWRDGVYPLRLAQGYGIPAAWTIPETNQFVWVLTYDGPESWAAKDSAYYATDARKRMNPDPGQWVARREHWFVSAVIP